MKAFGEASEVLDSPPSSREAMMAPVELLFFHKST